MNKRLISATFLAFTALIIGTSTASADVAPTQSMTHMKTAPGLAAALESAGVILHTQGGATSGVIGDSLSAANSQVVFHIPITANKLGVQHLGSNIVLFNTSNNSIVQLRNPVIDLAKGVVTATVPQSANQSITIFTISNAAELKAKVTTDKKTKIRSTAYAGAQLALAPGVAGTLVTLLGLPANAIAESTVFGSADVTLKRVVK